MLLQNWLAPVQKNIQCSLQFELTVGLPEFKKHSLTIKDQEMKKVVTSTKSIATMVASNPVTEEVKRAELKMAAFTVEHNISFQVMDHLSDLVTDIFLDSKANIQRQGPLSSMPSLIHIETESSVL